MTRLARCVARTHVGGYTAPVTTDGGIGVALLDEDFSSYTPGGPYTAPSPGVPAGPVSIGNLGFFVDFPAYDSYSIDGTVGYGTSTKSLKVTYGARPGTGFTNPRVNVSLGLRNRGAWTTRKELWLEGVAKFSANWKTDWGSPNQADHKFLLAVPSTLASSDATGRFSLKIGAYDILSDGPQIYHSAYRNNPTDGNHTDENYYGQQHSAAPINPWDGAWHTYRMHVAFDPATGMQYNRVWLDGLPWHTLSATGQLPMQHQIFNEIEFGANLNEQPLQSMSFWWGRLRVYDADPGWTFPNEIVGAGAVRVVDWTPTVAPGIGTPSADGLVNELGIDPVWGNLSSIVDDATMPGGKAIRSRFPQGFYGVPFALPSAGGPPYFRAAYYNAPVTIGQTHVVAYFATPISALRASRPFDSYMAPAPGIYGDGQSFNRYTHWTVYTDRVEFDMLDPIVANGSIPIALSITPQEAVRIFGPPFAWEQNDKNAEIYFAQYIRSTAGFQHGGNDGTKSVYAYSLGTLGGGWNPAIFCYLQRGNSSDAQGYPAFTNQFSGAPSSFFNVGGNSRAENINVFDGARHLVELWLKYESPYGSTNGEAKLWVDNVLVHHATGHRFWDAATTKAQFRQIKIYTIYGGGPASVPVDQSLYFGPIRVAVR